MVGSLCANLEVEHLLSNGVKFLVFGVAALGVLQECQQNIQERKTNKQLMNITSTSIIYKYLLQQIYEEKLFLTFLLGSFCLTTAFYDIL